MYMLLAYQYGDQKIRKITLDGNYDVTTPLTIAQTGSANCNGLCTRQSPIDQNMILLVCENTKNIRRIYVDSSGTWQQEVFAGTPGNTAGTDDGIGTAAKFSGPKRGNSAPISMVITIALFIKSGQTLGTSLVFLIICSLSWALCRELMGCWERREGAY